MKTIYHVGIYCRLSKDDETNSGKSSRFIPADESLSIANQRELLSKFVMLNGWIETKVYCDDGFSGGDFQRPGFQEMLEDARNGVINLILVKDLSRLGRDFVEVGRYADVVFPAMGVRFVSVLDCLDSDSDNTDMLHFRSLMNDYHLRDLSLKIKSVLQSKRLDGQYLAAYAPFGYRKSREDSHKLEIDEYAAGVVRRIFEMRRSNLSYNAITAALNRERIPPPRFYWYQQSGRDTGGLQSLWLEITVKTILRNEIYTGTLVMNFCGHRSYKDKTRICKPEAEWVRIENAHEAIVSKELWDAVQAINDAAKRRRSACREPTAKLFTGKLFCADCKSHMNANTTHKYADNPRQHYKTDKSYVTYHCRRYYFTGKTECSPHTVSELTLANIVSAEIRAQAKAVAVDADAAAERLKAAKIQYDRECLSGIQQEISMLRRRMRELEDMTAKLYEDKTSGAIHMETFQTLMNGVERELHEKAERLEQLTAITSQAEQDAAVIQDWTTRIQKYLDLKELDREIIDELIDRIEIGEHVMVDGKRTQAIKVFYRFVGSVEGIIS